MPAPASTQKAPATSQTAGNGRASQPAHHAPTQSSTQASASSRPPAWVLPLSRPHSQPAAAISTSAATQKGTGDG